MGRRRAPTSVRMSAWAVSLGLSLMGCAASRPLERALVTPADVEASVAAEKALDGSYERLPEAGEPWLVTVDGCAEVLLTAPHATNPTREGKLRFADRGSGGFAVALQRLTGARLIHTILASPSDPNFYDDNAFKEAIRTSIVAARPLIVLDLHASHPNRPYEVDFGTMHGRSLLGSRGEKYLRSLSRALALEGLTNQSRDHFPAEKQQTVVKWAAAHGVPAIQLEISSTWLSPETGALEGHRHAQLLQGIARFVASLGCRSAESQASAR